MVLMVLDFIPILNAFIITGSMILLIQIISKNFKLGQKANQETREEISVVLLKVIEAENFIVEQQKALDNKMNALARFVDSHSTNVAFQNEQFNDLAKTEMLAARREELRRLKELKIALERLMGVAMTSRQPPAPNDVLALEDIQTRINELEEILSIKDGE